MLREKFLRSLPQDEEMVSLSFLLPLLLLFAMLLPLMLLFAMLLPLLLLFAMLLSLLLLFVMLLHDFQQGERAVAERKNFQEFEKGSGLLC